MAATGTTAAGDEVPIEETERLIASDKVEGTAVYGADGTRLGAVLNFMVDKFTGRVAYVVMSFGGFLGLGERHHPLPWDRLRYDTGLGGYVLDVDPAALQGAPSYAAGESPWATPAFATGLAGYYGEPNVR
jgi:sporulation protein YlmC with PRC-barrel domain